MVDLVDVLCVCVPVRLKKNSIRNHRINNDKWKPLKNYFNVRFFFLPLIFIQLFNYLLFTASVVIL